MPSLADFSFSRGENFDLVVNISPPTPIGNWELSFNVGKRFGGDGDLINCYAGSGTPNGSSGITIQNSGAGIFSIAINPANTSGLDYGNYAYWIEKSPPGNTIITSEGFLKLLP